MERSNPENEIKPIEIKDLNKTQLILLAILLSFVTSIATGIVTVTLMQQAPTGVTQTINRVVQQTIEKVVPDYTSGKTQTVIVKEDDLVVDAVKKTRENFAALYATKDSTEILDDAYSIGEGSFMTASAPIDAAKTYTIRAGDASFEVKVVGLSELGFAILSATTQDANTKKLPAATFGTDADIKVGQSAVIVTRATIKKGLIQSVKKSTDENAGNTILLDINPTVGSIGSPVVNLDGEIIGVVVPKGDADAVIVGVDALTKFIAHPTIFVPKPVAEAPAPAN